MNLRVFNALRKLANASQPDPAPQQPKQQATPDNLYSRQTGVAPNTPPNKQGSTTPAQKLDPRLLSGAALGGLTGYAAGSNPKIRQKLIEPMKQRKGQ